MSLNQDMGDAHEAHLAAVLGMRRTRGSGNQWRDPMDGRHNRLDTQYAFAVDGKSTLGKSVAVSRTMWDKAVKQAGGERPLLGLRFYDTASLRDIHADLAVADLDDFAELLQAARAWEQAKPLIEKIIDKDPRCMPVLVDLLRRLVQETT